MRKLQKAAVIAAVISGVAVLGAGPASANDWKEAHKKVDVTQANMCRSHDVNVSLLNNVGVANGVLANLLGGEGDAGAQFYEQGSDVTCTNAVGGGDS